MYGSRVILKGKKYEGHYLLIESSARDGVPSMSGSLVFGEVSGASRLDMRQETREDYRQHHKIKFLLS